MAFKQYQQLPHTTNSTRDNELDFNSQNQSECELTIPCHMQGFVC